MTFYPLITLNDSTRMLDGTEPLPLCTHLFARARADRAIVAFDTEALGLDPDEVRTPEAVRALMEAELDSDPDGGVLWVPAAYEVAFVLFVAQALREAFEDDEFSFEGGGLSEGFFIHTVEDGLAVLLFDPEGGTGFFENTLERFVMEHRVPLHLPLATTFDPTRLQWFEDSHLRSNLALGRRTVHDAAMLLGLYERGVLDERFALDLNLRLNADMDAFFRARPVAYTGGIAPDPGMVAVSGPTGSTGRGTTDGYLRQWLEGTAHATVVDAPVAGGVLLVGQDPDEAVLAAAQAVGCPTLRAADLVAGLVRAFIATPRSPRATGLLQGAASSATFFDLED